MAEEKKEHAKKKKAHAGHGFKSTHVEHHHDGSHTVEHTHEEPEKSVKHAAANLDAVHDSMQDNMGSENPGEAEANAGQSGIPAEQEANAAGAAPAMGAAGPAGA